MNKLFFWKQLPLLNMLWTHRLGHIFCYTKVLPKLAPILCDRQAIHVLQTDQTTIGDLRMTPDYQRTPCQHHSLRILPADEYQAYTRYHLQQYKYSSYSFLFFLQEYSEHTFKCKYGLKRFAKIKQKIIKYPLAIDDKLKPFNVRDSLSFLQNF